MGGTLFSFHLTPKTSSKAYTESGFMTLSDKESSQITGFDFDIQAQEVVIQSGDSYGIETENDNENNRYHSYIKDGIWHVETPDNARANVTILDHTVYIPFGHRKANASPYTITLPSDVTFDNLIHSCSVHVRNPVRYSQHASPQEQPHDPAHLL